MKYFLVLLCLSLLTLTTFAQNRVSGSIKKGIYFSSDSYNTNSVNDTLHYMDGEGILYTSSTGGYVNGTNGYGDIGKYQRIDIEHPALITEVIMAFGALEIVGTPNTFNLVFRGLGAQLEPTDIFYTQTFTTEIIDTVGFTSFMLTTPVAVTSEFFVGLEWEESIDDLFGLISDEDGFGAGQLNRVWERWSDGDFYNYMDESSWELDFDLWIGVIFDNTTSVNPEIGNNSFALNQNYPNPFNPSTSISFNLPESGFTTLAVYDLLGREVAQLVSDYKESGYHNITFDASNLSSGVYFYKINSGNFSMIKKMSLLK
jgi:hypothetical protein